MSRGTVVRLDFPLCVFLVAILVFQPGVRRSILLVVCFVTVFWLYRSSFVGHFHMFVELLGGRRMNSMTNVAIFMIFYRRSGSSLSIDVYLFVFCASCFCFIFWRFLIFAVCVQVRCGRRSRRCIGAQRCRKHQVPRQGSAEDRYAILSSHSRGTAL